MKRPRGRAIALAAAVLVVVAALVVLERTRTETDEAELVQTTIIEVEPRRLPDKDPRRSCWEGQHKIVCVSWRKNGKIYERCQVPAGQAKKIIRRCP